MVAQLFHNFYDVQYIILLSFSFLFAYSDGWAFAPFISWMHVTFRWANQSVN